MSDPGQQAAKQRLESLGFHVDIISEHSTENRPDLRVAKESSIMFVEVKTRTENVSLRAAMEAIKPGTTEAVLTSLDKNNSLSSDIKKANMQLGAIAQSNEFRILWFRADNGLFIYDAFEQIKATLLGLRVVFGKRNGLNQTRFCCYASPADFFRYREIDGVIIEAEGQLLLIANQFSPRLNSFIESPIYAAIPQEAILDIRRAESNGMVYIIDGEVDRKDDQALLAFLRKKYPLDEFTAFGPFRAGTMVTTIDSRAC